jgi:hypothetical protein
LNRRLLAWALCCALTAAGLLAALPVVFGSSLQQIHVRWAPLSERERVRLEQQFALAEPAPVDQDTWSYIPTDVTPELLRTIVCHPDVQDTSGIDRSGLALGNTPLSARRGGLLEAPQAARVTKLAGYVLATIAIALLACGAIVSSELSVRRALRTLKANIVGRGWRHALFDRLTGLATRGVPDLPAEVLGFFRVCFALFLVLAVVAVPVRSAPGVVADGWPDVDWIGWLLARPERLAALERLLFVALGLFAIGLCTRVAYWVVAAGLTIYAAAGTQSYQSSVHVWMVAIFAVLCLVAVPWHATPLSADEVLRRFRGRPSTRGLSSKRYGFAIWMPGFILGTVWASAAYSKLEGGFEWMTGGAVKYHWVIDAAKGTPVEWGLWVASHHWAAVVLSFFGVFFEAAFIFAAFAKPGVWRNILTSTGLFLLIGFFLFNNVLWWPWWLVYLSFAVPWERAYSFVTSHSLRRKRENAPSAGDSMTGRYGLRPIHGVLIALVCMHGILQLPAGFGRFGSYANTYRSTAAFDLLNPLPPVERLWYGYDTPLQMELDAPGTADAMRQLPDGASLPEASIAWIDASPDRFGVRFDRDADLTLTSQQRTFNWTEGRFELAPEPLIIASADLGSMRIMKNADDQSLSMCQ